MIDLNNLNYQNRTITKEELLSKVSEYDIFRYYIGNFDLGQTYNSPLRNGDEIPSFNIFYSDKHKCLLFKDFAGKRGDCIMFVMYLFNISSYNETIKKIYNDIVGNIPNPSKLQKEITTTCNTYDIKIVIREIEQRDIRYWLNFGITENILDKFDVYPIKGYWSNNYYVDTSRTLAYAFVEYKDERISYKIYRPLETKSKKFRNNHSYGVHSGYRRLPKYGKLMLITKSLKDVMSLYSLLKIPSIGIQSETCFIKDTVIEEYKDRFENLLTLFDNDIQGIEQAEAYKKLYNIDSIVIPKFYDIKDSHIKDFSDLVQVKGSTYAENMLINIIRNKLQNNANNIIS